MAEIHLICGFMGFGKTTYAKMLEQTLPAIRFTHDEIMLQRYGRTPDNFPEQYKLVDDFIRQETIKLIKAGKNVILDYGFWSKAKRKEYYQWAKNLTPEVYFHAVICDVEEARKRVLNRTADNPNALFIDEACFNARLLQYEPLTREEGYPITFYHSETTTSAKSSR